MMSSQQKQQNNDNLIILQTVCQKQKMSKLSSPPPADSEFPEPEKVADSGNRSPIESLSLQEIQRLLDDIKLDPSQEREQLVEVFQKEDGMPSDETEEQEPDTSPKSNSDSLKPSQVILNRNQVIFGQPGLVPGAIDEVDFSVSVSPRAVEEGHPEGDDEEPPHILRIIALCKNEEFESLDEYVFSVRSSNCMEYYQEIRFKIKRGERADIKIAVKIPQLTTNRPINGIVEVRLGNLEPMYVPITAQCIVPDVVCLRTLYKEDEGVSMIKVPAKKCQQRTPPIPFKNNSPFNLSFEVEAISNENFDNKPYDIVVQNFTHSQANAQFFVNMQLRQNVNYTGIIPSRATIRKILTLKIRNSSVVFHFPIEVNIYEGQSLEGN